MGLLEALGFGGNPLYQAFDGNRRGLTTGFASMLGSGNDARGALKAYGGGLERGAAQDDIQSRLKAEQAAAAAKVAAEQAQQEQQIAWLKQNAPQYAGMVQAGVLKPEDVGGLMTAKDGAGASDPASVAEYKFYANQELKAKRAPLSYADWRKGSNQTVRSGLGQPVSLKNRKTGEYAPFQPMSDGTLINTLTQQPANEADWLYDPAMVQSDKSAGSAFGTAQGGVQFNLPAAKQNVDQELANIDAILADKTGLSQTFGNAVEVGGVGIPNQWLPTLPNTPKANMAERVKQVVGQNFLQAFSSLKGAGAITEVEGSKAQEAMARLGSAQDQKSFEQALTDLKDVLKIGYDRMSGQAAAGPYQSSGYTPPALGNGGGNTTSTGVNWSVSQ